MRPSPARSTHPALKLLEEAGVPYLTFGCTISAPRAAPTRPTAPVHPHKKVPAIVHDGVVVAESAAICAYVADAFPEAGLGPRRSADPLRGPFLSWLAHYNARRDRAGGVRAAVQVGREHLRRRLQGKWDDVERSLRTALSNGPYILSASASAPPTC